jgi:tetratricopeptide (TPR) repeat protein
MAFSYLRGPNLERSMSDERVSEAEQEAAEQHAVRMYEIGRLAAIDKEWEKALTAYTAAIEAADGVEGRFTWRVMVRAKRGEALFQLDRPAEALAVYDELVALATKLKEDDSDTAYFREVIPNVLPRIYCGRVACLDQLDRYTEVRDAMPAAFEEIGTPSTEVQRLLLSGLHYQQAKLADIDGDYGQALKAIDELDRVCSESDEPWAQERRREVVKLRQTVARHEQQASYTANSRERKPGYLMRFRKRRD